MINIPIFPKINSLWTICIVLRLTISFLPLIYNYLKEYGINEVLLEKIKLFNKLMLFIIGLGFLYKSFFGSNNEIQIKKVFWHKTRIIHSLIYIAAAINFDNLKLSSGLLFIDVLFSFFYRFIIGHFKYT